MAATTVLVLTSVEDSTADLVITQLNRRGTRVARVDPADIGTDLTFATTIGVGTSYWSGRLRTPSREVDLGQVEAVYHRRPGPWRFGHLPQQAREFSTAEARHGLGGVLANLPHARYVNHPAAISRAEVKPTQLRTAAQLGLRVPPTLVTNDLAQARGFAAVHGPVVYKTFRGVPPSADGLAGAIWTQRIDPETLDAAVQVTAHLFQGEIPKIGDVRVTVVGRRVFAQRIAAPDGSLDWRSCDWETLVHAAVPVPRLTTEAIHAYLDAFGLAFGCFDFALTGPPQEPAHWTMIECNPNGQWGWLPDADAIAEAFADVLVGGQS